MTSCGKNDADNELRLPLWAETGLRFGLLAVVVAVYFPSLGHGFVYDDRNLIVREPVPRDAGDVLAVFGERHWPDLPYYRPVVRMTMVGQKYLHGNAPAPYHFFNVAVIALGALVVFEMFRTRVSPQSSPQGLVFIHPVIAWWAALLFAVHPIVSCTVYPIASGRETLIPTVLGVLAVLAWARPGVIWYVVALLAFAAALWSKEQSIVLPGIFVLADRLKVGGVRDLGWRGWLLRYLPVCALVAFYLLLRWQLFGGNAEHRFAVLDRPAGPLLSVLYTLQTAVFPFVELVYEPPREVWLQGGRLLATLVVVVTFLLGVQRRWRHVGVWMFFWLGWFALAILPTANVLQQQAEFAERYGALSLVALVGALAVLASSLWSPRSRRWILTSGCVLVLASAAVSVHRGHAFADNISFYRQWVRTNPESVQARMGLGEELLAGGQPGPAASHFEHVLSIAAATPFERAFAHYALGRALVEQRRLDDAMRQFRAAVEIRPEFVEARNSVALALVETGDLVAAQRALEAALQIDPSFAQTHNNLGTVLARQGLLSAAEARFRQAAQLEPGYAEAYFNLGNALAMQGHFPAAADCFQRAVELRPDYEIARQSLQRALEVMRLQN